jgi:hypothetical protein
MPQFVNQTPTLGYTTQNQGAVGTLSPDVQQGPGASPFLMDGAMFGCGQNGYLAWSMAPEDAIAAILASALNNIGGSAMVTGNIMFTKVLAPVSGVTTKVDYFPVSIGSSWTNILLGLYSTSGTLLTGSTTVSTFTGFANTQQTVTWTTPTVLVAGTFYYVGCIITWSGGAGTAPSLAGTLNASGAALNAGLTLGTAESQWNGNSTTPTLPTTVTFSSGTTMDWEYFFALH